MKRQTNKHKIRVGILGASGYMGGELLRVLLQHPLVDIAWATSRQNNDITLYHPNLYDCGITLISPEDITPCDLIFMALPTEQSMEFATKLSSWDCRLIDLGATFRLSKQPLWESIYQIHHQCWDLSDSAIYGISELHYQEIQSAKIIANPGCFSSAAILALAPLMPLSYIDKKTISISGLSGTAGIGAELADFAHHPEISNNLVPYNVVNHRHSFEMEQELSLLSDSPVSVHFTPVYVPVNRGILNICSVFSSQEITRSTLLNIYKAYFADHPFVSVISHEKQQQVSWQYRPYPWISAVHGTNRCLIGIDCDPQRGRIVIFSALDNLGKGGAQVGIENMNIMFGFDRETGLKNHAIHP